MHIIQLPLCTRQYDVRALNKRFYEMNHIHNVLVKHGIEQLKALKSDPEYVKLLQAYKNATKTKKKTYIRSAFCCSPAVRIVRSTAAGIRQAVRQTI